MGKSLIRFVVGFLGLLGLGFIVFEVLRKWELIPTNLGALWIVIPILLLFICREISGSARILHALGIAPDTARHFRRIIHVALVMLAILTLVSIPFLWFGTIEELAGRGGK